MGILPPVVGIEPSSADGRRVRIAGRIMGMGHSLRDLQEFLRHAGLEPDAFERRDVAVLVGLQAAGKSTFYR
ncbi:hypothetical protein [Streptomyces xantholiticus]|uniref:hypothetical protein n=1 Tax=Streptomyces xantholiticus TaxID=68285 RepID=UPI00198F68E2|nr:hypothetical protein [Streptomyces xantholiticus]GGW22649.1 hypothetical protein GCM10010381_00800 [Streptomyces xantholiticus]